MASRPRRILPLSRGWRCRMRDTTAGGTRSASTLLPEELVERIERRLSLEGAQALADLAHQLPVGSDGDRLLPAFELVRADQHRGRAAIPGDDHFLIGGLDVVDQFAELRFDLGERERLQG